MENRTPSHLTATSRGPTLAIKLAACLALLVAAFMGGFGLVLHRNMEDTIRAQLEHAAVDAARTAAQVDLVAWTRTFDTIDQGLTIDEIQARVDAGTIADFEVYDADPERLAAIAWNEGRFERFLEGDTRILAVEVFRWEDGERGMTVGAAYPGTEGPRNASFAHPADLQPARFGAGEAQAGTLTVGERSWPVVRGSHPIVGPDGAQTGEVVVHVHASSVAEASAAFSENVTYAGAIFMAIGALFAYIMARILTNPVRRLQDDARAVVSGDLEHHTLAHSSDEIGQLARTFETMTRWLARAREAEDEAEGFRHELAAAADVTESLFPRRLPSLPGWALCGLHDREASPGGGIYDGLELPDGRLGLLVADSSVGGAPGALVAALARAAVRVAAERHGDPGQILREANGRLAPDLGAGLTVGALLLVLDPQTGRVSVANAGHAPVLHLHAAVGGVEPVLAEGLPLGAGSPSEFDERLAVADLDVEPGDALVLFASDLSLLSAPDGEVLGERRLAELVRQAAGLPADEIVERLGTTLRTWHGGETLGADVTLVAVSRGTAAAPNDNGSAREVAGSRAGPRDPADAQASPAPARPARG